MFVKRLFRFLFKGVLWLIALSIFWVFLYKLVPVTYTVLMFSRMLEGEPTFALKHEWKSIDNISVELQLAVICSEDQNFLNHHGFDLVAIKESLIENKEGKRLRGGSSISQQTAKNVFLWQDRSWLRKGLETWFTILIELLWSKERILEVYLNSIEMGNGIFGAEAAANYWFHTSAKNLDRQQASAIAAILPNPRKLFANPASKYINNRKNWIQKQMLYFGKFELKKEYK